MFDHVYDGPIEVRVLKWGRRYKKTASRWLAEHSDSLPLINVPSHRQGLLHEYTNICMIMRYVGDAKYPAQGRCNRGLRIHRCRAAAYR